MPRPRTLDYSQSRNTLTMSRSVCALLLAALCVTEVMAESAVEAGAVFLQSVIRRMQHDKFINSGEEFGDNGYRPTPSPHHQYSADVGLEEGPPHPLSKAELLSLYQAVVAKGSGLNLGQLPPLPLSGESDHHNQHNQDHHNQHNQDHHNQHNQDHHNQHDHDIQFHHNHQDPQPHHDQQHQDDLVSPSDQGTIPGYYYYFYPIKSFMPNATGDNNSSAHDMMMMMMTDGQDMADDNKDNRIDPLFLAVAGFVSMATIVSFSILFLPKFGDHRSHDKASLKDIPDDEDEMFSLTRVVGQAIQGQDCAERLACELGRAIRTMKLGQKPLRVIELMLPPQLAKQMSQVRQHMVKREKCQFIACKRANPLRPKLKPATHNKKKHPKL